MKTKINSVIGGLLAICILFSFVGGSFGAPTPAPSPSAVLLVQAYHTLEMADHDYKGHRRDAMNQIEAAAKLLGVKVKGDGKAREPQGVSDEQLRVAQGLLQQALPGLTGKPLQHTNNALKQIATALAIK